jgi:hypothetical protein
MDYDSVVWEWPERRGLEHLQLWTSDDGIKAKGLVVVDLEDGTIRFRYSIALTSDWRLARCGVFVPTRAKQNSIWLMPDEAGNWTVDKKRRPDLDGCVAFDLLETPFPKTGLVKVLNLEPGESKTIKVVLLDNRHLAVTPVEQQWERLSDYPGGQRYRCKAATSVSEFELNQALMVEFSAERWRLITGPRSARRIG